MKPRFNKRKRVQVAKLAKQRAKDFHAGLEAAHKQVGPVIMRRYFLRGMLVGAALVSIVTNAVWVLW